MQLIPINEDIYTSALVNKYFSQFPWTAVYGERESEGIPKKPDPSAALEIADLMKLPKEEILYIGDSKTDMQTGQNAGMDTIGVSWGFRGEKNWKKIMHPMWLIIRKIS